MPAKPTKIFEKPESGARHCLLDIPYRMIVLKGINGHGVPLYLVAGSNAGAAGAEKALRTAHKLHGGRCFYCEEEVAEISIDHVEPEVSGGSDSLQNLLIACKPCNASKGRKPIEAFHARAGREWLQALLDQVQDRLNRLD